MNICFQDIPWDRVAELLEAGADVRLHRVTGTGVIEASPLYPPLVPNAETVEAMRELERGEDLASADTVEELFAQLHAADD
jgi:hypothetical protein